jgi:hypothetical protein
MRYQRRILRVLVLIQKLYFSLLCIKKKNQGYCPKRRCGTATFQLKNGFPNLSMYVTKNDAKIWLVTEKDRGSTSDLLPGDIKNLAYYRLKSEAHCEALN